MLLFICAFSLGRSIATIAFVVNRKTHFERVKSSCNSYVAGVFR